MAPKKESPTESYRFGIIDFSKIKPKPKPVQKEYEIWIGSYHLGQGSNPSTKPEKIGVVKATSFKVACWLRELEGTAASIREQMENPNAYIEDIHFGSMSYNPITNSNMWLGKYYETEEEALESFKN